MFFSFFESSLLLEKKIFLYFFGYKSLNFLIFLFALFFFLRISITKKFFERANNKNLEPIKPVVPVKSKVFFSMCYNFFK